MDVPHVLRLVKEQADRLFAWASCLPAWSTRGSQS